MLYPIIVLFLVPSTLARSPVTSDDRMVYYTDPMSRWFLSDLHMNRDVPVSGGSDTTVQWTSGYKMKSTDGDTCRLQYSIHDRSNGNFGFLNICGSRSIPIIGFDCFQACEMDRNANINICMQVCPRPRASSIKPFVSGTHHLKKASLLPLAKLLVDRTANLPGQEYGIGLIGVEECYSFCIEDDSGDFTGCLYDCRPYEVPEIKLGCLRACEFTEENDVSTCMVVCPRFP